MQISVKQLKVRIEHTREQATKLLRAYGADVLIDLINELPTASDFGQSKYFAPIKQITKEKSLLSAFMKLTNLMKSSRDLNEYLQSALVDCVTTFEFDRCSFLMMSDDKSQVKSRFAFNHQAEDDTTRIAFHIRQSDNAIGRVLESKVPALINDFTHRQWRDLITRELVTFIQESVGHAYNRGVFVVSSRVIGLSNKQVSIDSPEALLSYLRNKEKEYFDPILWYRNGTFTRALLKEGYCNDQACELGGFILRHVRTAFAVGMKTAAKKVI